MIKTVFRLAERADVPAIVALLRQDSRGALGKEIDFDAAFDDMSADPSCQIVVGEIAGRIIATYQIAIIRGLSLRAARRGQVESVRVARDMRGHGIGRLMMKDAETRARAAGCNLLQLTMDTSRDGAGHFYASIGFTASHVGYKQRLD